MMIFTPKLEKSFMTLEQLYEYDHALVPGIFKTRGFNESSINFQFYKYKEDGVLHYRFDNMQRVVIPKMVAEELRKQKMFSYDYE